MIHSSRTRSNGKRGWPGELHVLECRGRLACARSTVWTIHPSHTSKETVIRPERDQSQNWAGFGVCQVSLPVQNNLKFCLTPNYIRSGWTVPKSQVRSTNGREDSSSKECGAPRRNSSLLQTRHVFHLVTSQTRTGWGNPHGDSLQSVLPNSCCLGAMGNSKSACQAALRILARM
jgi:hypothetical protein